MNSDLANYNSISWIFFAGNAKPTSMRRALAERLGEREPVIIVGRPVSLLRDKKISAFGNRCKRLSGDTSAWHYRPMHFPERVPGFRKTLRDLNQRLLKREVNQLLPKNGKRIVCYDSPTQDQLVGKLGEDLSIYLAIDDRTLTVWGEPIRREVEAEKRLLSRVDKVICVSDRLADVLTSRMPRNRKVPIHVLSNGYDERIFSSEENYPEPSGLTNVPRPRILMGGHISERIDWEGISCAVEARPDWTWVFIGTADKGMSQKIQNRLGSKGILHPPVEVEEVPAWIRHNDACAVPYRLNAFTVASSPLKAIEYLAMGMPTLSTRIPSLERYSGAIEWVEEGNGKSYAVALDRFMTDGKDSAKAKARRLLVIDQSWSNKVDDFTKLVFDGNK